jgi:hypothetical protein
MSTGHQVALSIKDETSAGSFGEGASKVRIDLILTGGHLTFKWSAGEYGLQSWAGSAVWDANRILAYVKDSPAKGVATPIVLTRVGD